MVLFAVACKKTTSPPQTPPSSNNNPTNPGNPNNPSQQSKAYFIPNWYSGDTLLGYELDSTNQSTGYVDTIFTLTIKDTSFVVYKGKRYYIWTEPIAAIDTFEPDADQYGNCVISPTTDIKDAISESWLNIAVPHKHKDLQGNWSYTRQSIIVNDWTNFKKVNFGYYASTTLYK